MKSIITPTAISLALLSGTPSLYAQDMPEQGERRKEVLEYQTKIGNNVKKIIEPTGLKVITNTTPNQRSVHIGYPLLDTRLGGHRSIVHFGVNAEKWRSSGYTNNLIDMTKMRVTYGLNINIQLP